MRQRNPLSLWAQTVEDNIVAFALNVRDRAHRLPKQAIRKRIGELLELVQMAEYGKRYPSELSGSQRQGIALARALAVEPKVLLLDEPFGALDAQVRRDLRRWLRDIHRHTGHTTVLVTHDQEEALELADRVPVLSNGRIEQVGTPDDVYDPPPRPSFIASSANRARSPSTRAEARSLSADAAWRFRLKRGRRVRRSSS